ncbi:hypothetical protein SDC9_107999 [bioreactor metagenome]|uniref:Uncharacterized protein n=1 Tax=bioreactor metagenome TaxID=1076179 RepID=A0A645B6T6_9ZZZZ
MIDQVFMTDWITQAVILPVKGICSIIFCVDDIAIVIIVVIRISTVAECRSLQQTVIRAISVGDKRLRADARLGRIAEYIITEIIVKAVMYNPAQKRICVLVRVADCRTVT